MKKIILIGDIVDKGKNLKDTIEFVYKNWKAGTILMVLGNHENYVYKALKGIISNRDKELEKNFFDSIIAFEQDEELKLKFFELVEASKEFLSHRDFIVTHAPCKENVLGKITSHALKSQRNLIYPKRPDFENDDAYIEGLENFFSYIKDEAKFNHPTHIMGHVAVKRVVNFLNKYMIDTGCATGGQLTSVQINKYGKPFIQHVNSKTSIGEDSKLSEVVSIFERKQRHINLDSLEPDQRTRIKFLAKDKINFISGTMSPADKNIDSFNLESLQEAIKYYKDAGVKKIILQPKYMGSRGNLYLFKEIEKTYLVSRNGYKVKANYVSPEDIIAMAKPHHEKLIGFFEAKYGKGIKMILLDCEVLPWRLMGKGLVEQQFIPVGIGIRSETQILEETGFEEKLEALKTSPEYIQYLEDSKTLNKDQLTENYGNAKERTFRNYKSYVHIPLTQEKELVDKYETQVKLYGDDQLPKEFRPFSILKIVFEDDSEQTFENESNIEMFEILKDENTPYAILNFEEHDNNVLKYPEEMTKANDYIVNIPVNGRIGGNTAEGFYNYITSNMKMEGVVVKPEKVFTKGIAPYLKVRNKEYLRIVYGYNYTFEKKFEKLIRKKSVKRKLSTSISEYDLGMKMLAIPYASINEENNEYKQLAAQMIFEVESEHNLDPRL